MNHQSLSADQESEITSLFKNVFTDSEGNDEGNLIGSLVEKLSKIIDNESTICYGTFFENELIASIFFTKLFNPENISIYMLAPVAVSTSHQGKGIGQSLIKYGLQELKERSSHVAVTYGDPAFYSKVGFEPLSENLIQAPLKMSIPEGWLGLSLTSKSIPAISSKPTCVEAFNDPTYW
jgi:putative acetyltransferase